MTVDMDGEVDRTDSGDEVSLTLSSDVLFEFGKSDLTNEAKEILEQVATEINDSSGETILIEGHADNIGSDSVNIPLSRDRAESVKDRLEELITRNGVSYKIEGHGSSQPIATNETEEGREKNRRVSVTFEK